MYQEKLWNNMKETLFIREKVFKKCCVKIITINSLLWFETAAETFKEKYKLVNYLLKFDNLTTQLSWFLVLLLKKELQTLPVANLAFSDLPCLANFSEIDLQNAAGECVEEEEDFP